jgi:hypothetical protein
MESLFKGSLAPVMAAAELPRAHVSREIGDGQRDVLDHEKVLHLAVATRDQADPCQNDPAYFPTPMDDSTPQNRTGRAVGTVPADDVPGWYQETRCNAAGNRIAWAHLIGPGTDTVWFTDDDLKQSAVAYETGF